MAITSTGSTPKTHYGDTNMDGAVLIYGPDCNRNEARSWLSTRTLDAEVLAAMLAGCYKIQRPAGKEVLKPRNEVFPDCLCIDLRSAESLQDPRTLCAIALLDEEGSDTSPIHLHAAMLADHHEIARPTGKVISVASADKRV